MGDNNWQTSVNELFEIFRGTLISIIPWIEKAKIPWRNGESYDDWDNIVETLYQNIVCNTLTANSDSEYSLAVYDIEYDNYSNLDFILVKSPKYSNADLIFISYQTKFYPLDEVKVALVDKTKNVDSYLNLKSEELEFLYIRHHGKDNFEVISELKVVL